MKEKDEWVIRKNKLRSIRGKCTNKKRSMEKVWQLEEAKPSRKINEEGTFIF